MNKTIKWVIYLIVILILILFVIRLINPREIDDITPEIPCPELSELNIDVLWAIPEYEGNSIGSDKNMVWCAYIKGLDRDIGMHGINHSYWEFRRKNISQEELDFAMREFEECFGYKPEMFKPPQLRMNKENKKLIKGNDLFLKKNFNQIFHKVYHCNDSGRLSNRMVKLF